MARLMSRIGIVSGYSMLLISGRIVVVVDIVVYVEPSECRFRTKPNGVNFVDQISWTMYAYVNGVR